MTRVCEYIDSLICQFIEKYPWQRKKQIDTPILPSWPIAKRRITKDEIQSNPPPTTHANDEESIFLIEIMHPTRNSKRSQFMIFLGSQTLADLADAVYCVKLQYFQEYKHLHSSQMFFIGKTFYIDRRDVNHLDYSKEIKEWILKNDKFKAERLKQFGSSFDESPQSIDKTKLLDLQLALDEEYVFCHLGDCEHIVAFRNIRLRHDLDEQNPLEYPMRIEHKLRSRQKCLV